MYIRRLQRLLTVNIKTQYSDLHPTLTSKSLEMAVYVITGVSKGIGVSLAFTEVPVAFV
jgi:hypothetical protein